MTIIHRIEETAQGLRHRVKTIKENLFSPYALRLVCFYAMAHDMFN
jgi:hypothetical protein